MMKKYVGIEPFYNKCLYQGSRHVLPFLAEVDGVIINGRVVYQKNEKFVYYFLPVSEDANYMLAFVYLPNIDITKFDHFQTYYHESVKNKWPLFYEAVIHSGDYKCYKPSFLRLNEKYLGLAIRLDNVGPTDFDNSYCKEKIEELFSYVLKMSQELEENKITMLDKAKGYGEVFVKGYKKATLVKAVVTISLAIFGFNG